MMKKEKQKGEDLLSLLQRRGEGGIGSGGQGPVFLALCSQPAESVLCAGLSTD